MSVLIKGMEMPKDKAIAVVIHPDGTAYSAEMFAGVCTKYLTDCEAIPVPPHGRLIDADALEKEHMKRAYENFRSYQFHVSATAWINEAPTIIPAEEET